MALALAVLAAGVGRWCRRPAVRHGLWLLVLLKLLTPPLVPVPIAWPDADPAPAAAPAVAEVDFPLPEPAPRMGEPPARRGEAGAAAPPAGEAEPVAAPRPGPEDPVPGADLPPPEPAPRPPPAPAAAPPGAIPWVPLAVLAWLTGAVCWFTLAGARIRRFHGLLAHATVAPMELQAEAAALAVRLGLARCPRVWVVPGVLAPMLWALGRAPRLLLPAGLLDRLAPDQRATLLAHELAHLKRRDHWVRLLELAVLG